jgi:hypothetical protein
MLRIPAQGGDVKLRLQGSLWEDVPLFSLWLIGEDGSAISPELLGGPGGDTRSIRQLAPGRWHLVLLNGRPDLSLLMAGSGRQIPPIAVFEVQPGGQTTIDVAFRRSGAARSVRRSAPLASAIRSGCEGSSLFKTPSEPRVPLFSPGGPAAAMEVRSAGRRRGEIPCPVPSVRSSPSLP